MLNLDLIAGCLDQCGVRCANIDEAQEFYEAVCQRWPERVSNWGGSGPIERRTTEFIDRVFLFSWYGSNKMVHGPSSAHKDVRPLFTIADLRMPDLPDFVADVNIATLFEG